MLPREQIREVLAAIAKRERPDVRTLLRTWPAYARPRQIIRPDGRPVVNLKAGRGSGKTRTGDEHTLDLCEAWGPAMRGLVASKTESDTIETLVLGPAGLLQCARARGYSLDYSVARGVITHPAGGTLQLGTGQDSEIGRGLSINFALLDELAWWTDAERSYANIRFALRLGAPAPGRHMLVTSTPSHLCKLRLDDERIVQTIKGRTIDNAANLGPGVLDDLQRSYDGHPLGRQELDGEDVNLDGAIATLQQIHDARIDRADVPELESIVVGVDPGGFSTRDPMAADLTGIVVVGIDANQELYVLDDWSIAGDATVWAKAAIDAWSIASAGRIVIETNQGGNMTIEVLQREAARRGRRCVIEPVIATKAKRDRALPASQQYALGRVHHVDVFRELESEVTSWSPKSSRKSPDRLDALVHAVNALLPDDDGVPHVWE